MVAQELREEPEGWTFYAALCYTSALWVWLAAPGDPEPIEIPRYATSRAE